MADHLVLLGPDQTDRELLRAVAAEFEWEVAPARGPDRVVAVLLQRDAFGPGISWPEAIRRCRRAIPDVRIITCHDFMEQIDWGELYDLGTFHAVRTLMKEEEVRQSLGFLWEAEQRAAALRQPIPIQRKQKEWARDFEEGRSYAAG
jgi:hypothetical protein